MVKLADRFVAKIEVGHFLLRALELVLQDAIRRRDSLKTMHPFNEKRRHQRVIRRGDRSVAGDADIKALKQERTENELKIQKNEKYLNNIIIV